MCWLFYCKRTNELYFSIDPHQYELCPLHEGLPLVGTILRLLQDHSDAARDSESGKEEKKDEQLQMLADTAAEFLADICVQISKVEPNIGNFNFSFLFNVSI